MAHIVETVFTRYLVENQVPEWNILEVNKLLNVSKQWHQDLKHISTKYDRYVLLPDKEVDIHAEKLNILLIALECQDLSLQQVVDIMDSDALFQDKSTQLNNNINTIMYLIALCDSFEVIPTVAIFYFINYYIYKRMHFSRDMMRLKKTLVSKGKSFLNDMKADENVPAWILPKIATLNRRINYRRFKD